MLDKDNEPNLATFAGCLTNGVNEQLATCHRVPSGGGGCSSVFEADLVGTSTDLAGHQIAEIRLVINSLSVKYNAKQDDVGIAFNVQWEIWAARPDALDSWPRPGARMRRRPGAANRRGELR